LNGQNAGLFQPKFGSYMDKIKCWFKNAIQKITVESESWYQKLVPLDVTTVGTIFPSLETVIPFVGQNRLACNFV